MSRITDIKEDPTGRRTLLVAFITLLATILVPAIQYHFEVKADSVKEAIAEKQHEADVLRIEQLQQQLVQEHKETIRLESVLVTALQIRRAVKK